jgi:hypothetical protein
MNSNLKHFYDNVPEREAVKTFLIETLQEMAIKRVFDKQTVAGIYEANKAIERCFDRLEELYGATPPPVNINSR